MKKVAILMSTYNGEKYLDEQIESLIVQEGVEIKILVRDDGSSDNTVLKLKKWEQQGILSWYTGENLKPGRSFMDLIKKAPESDYYAFCDQDDVWDKDKLICAVKKIEKLDSSKPSLYFSNTRLVDSNLIPIKTKKKPALEITLESALLVNVVTGCTEVFNYSLLEILKKYDNKNIFLHDGWSYKVCMSIGGNAIFDENPHISYRQHENNVIGVNPSFFNKYKRKFKKIIIEKSRIREYDAIELIKGYSDIIPIDNMEKIKKVAYYRKSFKNKMELLFDKEIKTNSCEHNFLFACAVLLDVL